MKAMVLAAGLGTRLYPLTYEIPKPMVPVLDRPVMGHILDLLSAQGFDELVSNLHYFPDAIRGHFGDRFTWRYEEELLGTAGGVRNVADFFGDEPVVVVSGDALTDVDLTALVARHQKAGGIATLSVKRVSDTSQYGVVIHDEGGRVQGFQEKPDPAEALSDLANCGIYCFSPEIFDHFPDEDPVDWAGDVFPVLLERDIPFHVHEIDAYWNDVGSLGELRQGTFDALEGRLRIERVAEEREPGVWVAPDATVGALEECRSPVWIGAGATVEDGVRLMGPVVVGEGCRVGADASLRNSILFPGTEVQAEAILIDAIAGHRGIAQSLHPPG